MKYGVRAICKCLQTYQTKYHLQTIEQLIERWAPPSENNTKAYINNVSSHFTKFANGQTIVSAFNEIDLVHLFWGIVRQENGMLAYNISIEDENAGIALALG